MRTGDDISNNLICAENGPCALSLGAYILLLQSANKKATDQIMPGLYHQQTDPFDLAASFDHKLSSDE